MTEPSGFEGELTTISFVRLVILDVRAFTSTRHSGASRLYGTGFAPHSFASVGYETKPGSGTSTSSPSSTNAWKIAYSPSSVPAVMQASFFGSKSMPSHTLFRSDRFPALGE